MPVQSGDHAGHSPCSSTESAGSAALRPAARRARCCSARSSARAARCAARPRASVPGVGAAPFRVGHAADRRLGDRPHARRRRDHPRPARRPPRLLAFAAARARPGSGPPALSPRSSVSVRPAWRARSRVELRLHRRLAIADRLADRLFALDDAEFDRAALRCAAVVVLDFRRRRVLADGDPRARGVEQRSPPCPAAGAPECSGATAAPPPRSPHRAAATRWCFSSDRGDAAHHHASPWPRSGSSTCTTWNRRVSAGSFSMYFLYSAQVVAADGAQRAARQRRLEQVGRVAGAGRATRAHQRVHLVDEQHDRLGRGLHLVDHLNAAAARTRPSSIAPACSSPTSSDVAAIPP